MGINISKKHFKTLNMINFQSNQWQPIDKKVKNEEMSFGSYVTLHNKKTDQKIDQFLINFNSAEQYNQYLMCLFERTQEEYLVNALHLQPIITKQFCRQLYHARVYVQHMPVRLSDIVDIPIFEGLYILKCALLGYQKLFSKIGYFQVFQEQICIDQAGEVKVWMNANLSQHSPADLYNFGKTNYGQRAMCKQIITLISNNTEEQEQICSFAEFVQKYSKISPNFSQSFNLLSLYLKEYTLQLSKSCLSIVQAFNYNSQEQIINLENYQIDFKSRAISQQQRYFSNVNSTSQYQLNKSNFQQHNIRSNRFSSTNKQKSNRLSLKNCERSKSMMQNINKQTAPSTLTNRNQNSEPSTDNFGRQRKSRIEQNNYSGQKPTDINQNYQNILKNNHRSKTNLIQHSLPQQQKKLYKTLKSVSSSSNLSQQHPLKIKFTYSDMSSQKISSQSHCDKEQRNYIYRKILQNKQNDDEKMQQKFFQYNKKQPLVEPFSEIMYNNLNLSIIKEESIDPEILADLENYHNSKKRNNY